MQFNQNLLPILFIPIPEKGNAKECSNYCIIALISHTSKVILQARLQQYVNRELLDVQAGFRRTEEPEIKWPISAGSSKKQESSRKNIYFCFIDYAKAFDCVAQSCPTLCNPMDYRVHEILQARILELGSCCLLQGIFQTQESN